jgi:hypothetical protein
MTSKTNELEHEANVLAHENILLKVKNTRLEAELLLARAQADRFEHALNVANQGLENLLTEQNGTDRMDRLDVIDNLS